MTLDYPKLRHRSFRAVIKEVGKAPTLVVLHNPVILQTTNPIFEAVSLW